MIYNTRPDLDVSQASISVYNIDNQILEDTLHRDDRDEIILITQGTGIFQLGSVGGDFGPGTIAFTRSGTRHFWNSGREGEVVNRVSALVVHIPPNLLSATFLKLVEAKEVRSLFERIGKGAFVHLRAHQRIEARLRTLLGARGMLRVARTHALLDLLSRMDNWQVIEDKSVTKGDLENRARLKRIYQFIDAHFRSPLKRDSIAALVEMEPNSVSRFFHRASGQKLSDYLAVIRVRHAATLLGARQRMPVSEVAQESGFRNLSAFNRQFKKRLGVTPRSYRKQLNSEPVLP